MTRKILSKSIRSRFLLFFITTIMMDQLPYTTSSFIVPSQVPSVSKGIVAPNPQKSSPSTKKINIQKLATPFLVPSQAIDSNMILSMTSKSSADDTTTNTSKEERIPNMSSSNAATNNTKGHNNNNKNTSNNNNNNNNSGGKRHRRQRNRKTNQAFESSEDDSTIASKNSTTASDKDVDITTLSLRKKTNNNNRRKQKNQQRRKQKQQKKNRRMLSGNLPDIEWRAFPLEHLRRHPHFRPLPPSDTITSIDTMEDVRNFRQDSWQWDVLHDGRCTTSQAVAALGLLEPQAGRALGVPKSWLRGGTGAYYRLRQRPALRTLQQVNEELCCSSDGSSSGNMINNDNNNQNNQDVDNNTKGPIWIKPHNRGSSKHNYTYPFAAKYLPQLTSEERKRRRTKAQRYNTSDVGMAVRMNWGNAQEATSVLTALNYFWKKEPRIMIQEVGMCGAGLRMNNATMEDTASSLLVGASPDGLICYPDGTVEALEVKNHCPFVTTSRSWGKRFTPKSSPKHTYCIRDMPFDNPTVPPVYIPQLMMEMFCVGVECQSAVMVRQTATSGAAVLRIYRNDEWIDEMLYWLNKFQADYVEQEQDIPPPTNFFWNDPNPEISTRYEKFVKWTKQLCDTVEVLDIIKHRDIQRVMTASENHTSLFLD